MILVLYNKADLSTIDFINFLCKKNIEHIALDVDKDLIHNDPIIIDDGSNDVIITCGNVQLNFSKIKSVYNRVLYLEKSKFYQGYVEEDVEFVSREWWAYIFYRLELCKNVFNPSICAILSGAIMEFPYFYAVADKIGFARPSYVLSTNYSDLQSYFRKYKKAIAVNNVILSNCYLRSQTLQEKAIGVLQYIDGELILIHVINNETFACAITKNGAQEVSLSQKEIDLCLKLRIELELIFLQIQVRRNDNNFVLVNISVFPNWNYNTQNNIHLIHQALLGVLCDA